MSIVCLLCVFVVVAVVVVSFTKELSSCRGAAEFPLRPALIASTRFQGLIKVQKNLQSLVQAKSDDSVDPFNAYMGAFGREAEAAGGELKALGASTNEA